MNWKFNLFLGAIALALCGSILLANPSGNSGANFRETVALVRDFRIHDAATAYKELSRDDAAGFIDWLVQTMQGDTSAFEQHLDVRDYVGRCNDEGSALPSDRCAELYVRSNLADLLIEILSPVRSPLFQKQLLDVIKSNPDNPVIRQAFARVALASASFDETYLETFNLVMNDGDDQVAQTGYVVLDKHLSQALKIIDFNAKLLDHPDPEISGPARTKLESLQKNLRRYLQ